MFRYERPQAGRQRQFHQIGVELLGSDDPRADVADEIGGGLVVEVAGERVAGVGRNRRTFRAARMSIR